MILTRCFSSRLCPKFRDLDKYRKACDDLRKLRNITASVDGDCEVVSMPNGKLNGDVLPKAERACDSATDSAEAPLPPVVDAQVC